MVNLDPTFSINDYQKPKILTNMETYVNNVLMILFGKPGFYPSIPTLGMNIQQYLYKFIDEINETELKNKLVSQCKDFLPEVNSGELDVKKILYKNNILLIFKLPNINDTNEYDVAIGVTTNTRGEIVYNFVESDRTQVL